MTKETTAPQDGKKPKRQKTLGTTTGRIQLTGDGQHHLLYNWWPVIISVVVLSSSGTATCFKVNSTSGRFVGPGSVRGKV
jgi:hypothetical protein